MPSIRILLLALFGTISACLPAVAGPIAVTVRNQPVPATAIVESGHVMLPMRVTFETLNSNVFYDRDSGIISARNILHVLHLKIGSSTALLDGRLVPVEVPARLVRGRAYVPLSFAAQAMGAIVRYDPAANVVAVNGSPPAARETHVAAQQAHESIPASDSAAQATYSNVAMLSIDGAPVQLPAGPHTVGITGRSPMGHTVSTQMHFVTAPSIVFPGAPFGFVPFGVAPGGVVTGGLTIVGPPAGSGFSGTCTPAFGVSSCPFTYTPFNFATGRSVFLPTTTTGGVFLTGSPLNPLGQYPSGPIVNPLIVPFHP